MARKSVPVRVRKHSARRWTVMVFMGTDGLDGNKPLDEEAGQDIAEMLRVPPSDRLNIFVERHGGPTPTRQHIGHPEEPVPGGAGAANDGTALIRFITWAIECAQHDRELDYALLVLWGHAYRFGVAPRATRSGEDALDFAELAGVLHAFQERMKKHLKSTAEDDELPRLDIVGFDACDLATVEMACQLFPFARYLVASQIGIPLPGWPYHRILERLAVPKDRLMGPCELGSYIVRRYCESYTAAERVSLSLLNLDKAPKLFALTELLAIRLAAAASDAGSRAVVREAFRHAQTDEGRPFVDVADLCLTLYRACPDPLVAEAAERLGDFLSGPDPVVPDQSEQGLGRPFVADHGRNSCQTARLNGVSLYAPHLGSDQGETALSRRFYRKFIFAQQSMWTRLVHSLR